MEAWIIASLCLFFSDINTPDNSLFLSASPSTSKHQLYQHPNAMATASCDMGFLWGFPPSLASKDVCPGITRTPLRLNNICQINPQFIRTGKRQEAKIDEPSLIKPPQAESNDRENP